MNTASIEALECGWARISGRAKLPPDYGGTASVDAYRALQAIEPQIRKHVVVASLAEMERELTV